MPRRLPSLPLRLSGLVIIVQFLSPGLSYSQQGSTGFAFEAYAEPWLGILQKAPYRGWLSGMGVGYKVTPEFSLWLSALAGPGRRPRDIVGEDGPRDEFGLLRFSARRAFHLDSTVHLTPLVCYRISTFQLPDGTTMNGRGFEAGGGATVELGDHFEVGGEAAFTYDSYHSRSGPANDVPSFSGADLALRFLVRFHPAIP